MICRSVLPERSVSFLWSVPLDVLVSSVLTDPHAYGSMRRSMQNTCTLLTMFAIMKAVDVEMKKTACAQDDVD